MVGHCPAHFWNKQAETEWRAVWSAVSKAVIVSVHSHGVIYDAW